MDSKHCTGLFVNNYFLREFYFTKVAKAILAYKTFRVKPFLRFLMPNLKFLKKIVFGDLSIIFIVF